MKLLRNPEVKKLAVAALVVTAVFSVLGFVLGGWQACALVLCACAALSAVYLCFTLWRYRRIDALADEVSQTMHRQYFLDITEDEGELHVLKSEIYKLTVALREQADLLKRDRAYLADALSDISHQLKTPLTSLNLVLSLLRRPDLSEERRRELLREMGAMLSRMDWQVAALLKMSRLDAGTVQFKTGRVQVRDLVRQACEPVSIAMEIKGQELVVNGEEDACLLGDLPWCVEAVGNIVKNCMEHTPEGGRIEIEYEENPVCTQITVADTGPGIDAADLPHIFERFYKGKHAGEASVGIGLALARMIISSQNGTVKAENRPGGGTRFTIKFYKSAV